MRSLTVENSLRVGCAAQQISERNTGNEDCIVLHSQGDNYLTSTIPASWLRIGSFANLTFLGLAQNQLVGSIPTPELGCSLCRSYVSAPHLQ